MQQSAAILAVDDDASVISALKRLVRKDGVEVLSAHTGPDALALLLERADSVGAVISDYAMPGMSGADLLRTVRLQWPHITRLLLTGKADLVSASRAVNEGQVARLFTKPWRPDEIRRELLNALEQHYELRADQRRREQAAAREQQRQHREQALEELSHALATNLHETRTLQMIASEAARLLGGSSSRIWILDEQSGDLACAAADGSGRAEALLERLPADSLTREVVRRGTVLGLRELRPGSPSEAAAGAYLAAPILRAGLALGALEVIREVGQPFESDDERLLLQLANAAALAVANGRLWRQAHQDGPGRNVALDPRGRPYSGVPARDLHHPTPGADDVLAPLTAREREVLRLLASGKTNPQIALDLCVSPATARNHVEHILKKLGVSDRTQAAVRALQLGLLSAGGDSPATLD